MSTTEQAFDIKQDHSEFRESFIAKMLAQLAEVMRPPAVVPPCLAGPNYTPADPSDLADAAQFQETINREFATHYVDNVIAKQDELLGDLDNWKPRGILDALRAAEFVQPRLLVGGPVADQLVGHGVSRDQFDVSPEMPR